MESATGPGVIKVGLCGFTIGAASYFERFPVVEVQQTFYEPPAAATLRRWRESAPAGFEFTMKAWQVITHAGTSRTYRRMKTPLDEVQKRECGGFRLTPTVRRAYDVTLECARILRATAVLFQCPASFRQHPENVEAMREFFTTVERPRGVRFLWEPRGAWDPQLIRELCAELRLIDTVDPFLRPSTSAEIYWRLHGNGTHYASYTDDELQQLRGWLGDRADAYVMFNNIPRVADSARFVALL